MSLELVPVTLRQARTFVAEHHSHNGPPQGWLFGVGLQLADELVGVAIAGRPVAHPLQDGRTVEVTRVCTQGHRNACSRLYAAVCRAAAALGYRRAITYTLVSETAACVAAAGFVQDGTLLARPSWSTPSRTRIDTDLFGTPTRPTEAKVRWVRPLFG